MSRQDNSCLHGVTVFVALLLALTTSTAPLYSIPRANANGFTVLIAQGVAGPYEYLVGVWPPEPVVGKPLLMSIALSANQQPVTDASVNVTGTVNDQTVVGPRVASIVSHTWRPTSLSSP
jgi:hypothetical protein